MKHVPRVLAPPLPEVLAKVASYTDTVTEIGAGEGLWANDLGAHLVTVYAFDLIPQPTLVHYGDHNRAAMHGDGWLLAVWPPIDQVVPWIIAKAWPGIILVGQPDRWGKFRDFLYDYDLLEEWDAPSGEKGPNVMLVYRRK